MSINRQFTEKVQRPLNIRKMNSLISKEKFMLRNKVLFFFYKKVKSGFDDFWLSRVENELSFSVDGNFYWYSFFGTSLAIISIRI